MYIYRLALLLIFGIYLFSPVIMDWWLNPMGKWYRPFAIWLVLIAFAMWLEGKKGADEF